MGSSGLVHSTRCLVWAGTRPQFDQFVGHAQSRRSLQHDDPFMLVLVVPEIGAGSVSLRDDAFDAAGWHLCHTTKSGIKPHSAQIML